MTSRHSSLRRLASLAAAAALAAGLLASPVVAAPARPTAPTTAASAGGQTGRAVIARGRVVASRAAAASVGVQRRGRSLGLLRPARPAEAAGPTLRPRTPAVAPLSATRAPASVSPIAGNDDTTDQLNLEPPDPWVAASSTDIVHSTNGLIRMFSRTGATRLAIPTWALFALGPTEYDSDPRVLWDPAHGRWVGVLLSWTESFSVPGCSLRATPAPPLPCVKDGFLNVAVSETTDPTGAWQVFAYSFRDQTDPTNHATLPDFPGIASSADKVVLAANEFSDVAGSYLGTSIVVLAWADLLSSASPAPVLWTHPDPTLFTIRPARLASAGSDVPLVAEDMTHGDLMYASLTGSVPADPTGGWTDLSDASAASPTPTFCFTRQPRQPGLPPTISDAVDERPTDAVWSNGRLALVSTCAIGNDYVRVTQLDTTVSPPVPLDDVLMGGAGGADAYLGGIGYSTDGTLFLSYTQSSAGEFPSTYAAAFRAGAWSSPVRVRAGSTSYDGGRWGDFTGVALDPAGTAAVWQANETPNADGDWQTQVTRLVLDLVPPVAGAPKQALVTGSTLGTSTLPVRITWSATDPGSGVAATQVNCDVRHGGLAACATTTHLSVTRSERWKRSYQVAADSSYGYAIVARDAYGSRSPRRIGSTLTPTVYEQNSAHITWRGSWLTATGTASGYSGGSTRRTSRVGASATFITSGRSFGFVTSLGPAGGRARIYADGVLATTLTLTNSRVRTRDIAWTTTFARSGTHTIRVVVVSGRVDVDAFVVLR
jgi:hypothetical protein